MESIYQSCKGYSDPCLFYLILLSSSGNPSHPSPYRHHSTYSRVHSDRYRYFVLKDQTLRVSLTPSSSKPTRSTTLASLSINSWDASAQRIDSFASWILTVNPAWTAWQSKNASATCAVIRKDRLCMSPSAFPDNPSNPCGEKTQKQIWNSTLYQC